MRQAIELEAKTADWLEPANLSPNNAKMLQNLTADRGLSLESLAHDSLKELQNGRLNGGTADPNVDADFGGDAGDPSSVGTAEDEAVGVDADFLKHIQQIQSRNAAGGNRRVVG